MGSQSTDQSYFSFLSLPFEVRLQIYKHIIQDQPAYHSHLSTIHSEQPITSSAYFFQATSRSSDASLTTRSDSESLLSSSSLSHPSSISNTSTRSAHLILRGHECGHIPTALLQACKQIHAEACSLPFAQNEFVFTNWFSSGVYAARAFTRALKPWQCTSMRYARVELLKRDLENSWVASMVGGRHGTGEWKDLCALWSGGEDEDEMGEGGLWGLKLGIMGRVSDGFVQKIVTDGTGGSLVEVPEVEGKGVDGSVTREKTVILDVNASWVTEGLVQMKNLKWVEIEIEDDKIHRDDKVRFCLDLGRKLNGVTDGAQSNGDGYRRIGVIYVERVGQEKIVDRAMEVAMVTRGNIFMAGLNAI